MKLLRLHNSHLIWLTNGRGTTFGDAFSKDGKVGCILAHDNVDTIPEGQGDDIHPGIQHHHFVELPDGIRHLILHTVRLVGTPLCKNGGLEAGKKLHTSLQLDANWRRRGEEGQMELLLSSLSSPLVPHLESGVSCTAPEDARKWLIT